MACFRNTVRFLTVLPRSSIALLQVKFMNEEKGWTIHGSRTPRSSGRAEKRRRTLPGGVVARRLASR